MNKFFFKCFGFTSFKKEIFTIKINQHLLDQAIALNENTDDF